MIYFSFGIFFYYLFSKNKIPPAATIICIVFACTQLYLLKETGMRIFLLCALMLFSIFVYRPAALRFLDDLIVVRIGVISYGSYLIHEFVGLILIDKISKFMPVFMVKFVPVLVTFIVIAFAEVMYRVYETPVMAAFKKKDFEAGYNCTNILIKVAVCCHAKAIPRK